MGNKQSDAGAERFFGGIGGMFEKTFDAGLGMMTLPQQMMKGASDFISSPMGGIMLPIIAIGGLYVASQLIKK